MREITDFNCFQMCYMMAYYVYLDCNVGKKALVVTKFQKMSQQYQEIGILFVTLQLLVTEFLCGASFVDSGDIVVHTSSRGEFTEHNHIILKIPGKFCIRKTPPMGVFAAQMKRGTSQDNTGKK